MAAYVINEIVVTDLDQPGLSGGRRRGLIRLDGTRKPAFDLPDDDLFPAARIPKLHEEVQKRFRTEPGELKDGYVAQGGAEKA